jgi:hypothetical protein
MKSMQRQSGVSSFRGAVLLAWLLAIIVSAAALAAPAHAVVLPPSAQPYGATYSEWAAKWWQWALTQPASTNPIIDDTGELCGQGQSGPVWFLAGSFGGSVTRSCTVPAGEALLVPILNLGYFAFLSDPPEQRTEAFVRGQVTAVENATTLTAMIDGQAVPDISRYLEKSVLFSIMLPADNLFGLPEGFVLDPCVDEGYYIVVPPLSVGAHTIHFAAGFDSFAIDVTYELTVS